MINGKHYHLARQSQTNRLCGYIPAGFCFGLPENMMGFVEVAESYRFVLTRWPGTLRGIISNMLEELAPKTCPSALL